MISELNKWKNKKYADADLKIQQEPDELVPSIDC